MSSALAVVRAAVPRRAWVVFVALRPHQWTKNLLLFAGILFAAELDDTALWPNALAAFVAYCALSSASYLVNDVRDAEGDRLHETKRRRAVASGDLAQRDALVVAGALTVLGLALAAAPGLESLAFAVAFVVLQLAYTHLLKRVYLVDALTIAALFVVRAAAGAAAVDVHISKWLLVCTALLALFLALGKRRGELLAVQADRAPGRSVLARYSLRRLEVLVPVAAAGAAASYSVYALAGPDSEEMAVTIPFVVIGLLRYLYLARRHDVGEEPDRVVFTDAPLLATIAIWAATAAFIVNSA